MLYENFFIKTTDISMILCQKFIWIGASQNLFYGDKIVINIIRGQHSLRNRLKQW